MQLVQQTTWKVTSPAQLTQVQGWAQELVSIFSECPSRDLPFACPYDFSAAPGGWDNVNLPVPPWDLAHLGDYSLGLGWVQTDNHISGFEYYTGIDIIKAFGTPVVANNIAVNFSINRGSISGAPYMLEIIGYSMGSQVQRVNYPWGSFPDGNNTAVFAFTLTTIDTIEVQLLAGAQSSGPPGGDCIINSIEVRGVGPAGC